MKRVLTMLALAGLALMGPVGPARADKSVAHNSLIGSTPADESTVDTSPLTVELTFDEPAQPGELNTAMVTDAQGHHWEAGPTVAEGSTVTVPLRALGAAGVYTVGYRVVSADGHPASGSITFTLREPGTATPTAAEARQPGVSGPDGDGLPVWMWILGAAVLLGIGLTLVLRIGKRP